MIEETCLEIGELERHWTAERESRTARRKRIQYIDELIEEFERLNLADEHDVPGELRVKAVELVAAEAHPLSTRPADQVVIAEWMDALYDVQDSLMFASDDDLD